jgi:copper(I)-binding protein
VNTKPWWMRVIEALTLIFAIIAMVSPFVALIVPLMFQEQLVNQQSELTVYRAWVRPSYVAPNSNSVEGAFMEPGLTVAYMLIENTGGANDRLVSISTNAATITELHQTHIDDAGVARMRIEPNGIEVPSYSVVRIEPLSYHIMLNGLTDDLVSDQEITFELTFASGTILDVAAIVSDYAPEPLFP